MDDGFASKVQADAEALKKLGMSGAELRKLAAANPAIGKLTSELDALATKASKLDAFRAGSRNLKDFGASMRQARADTAREAAALARAQVSADAKATRSAERAHAAAMKRQAAMTEAFVEQGRAVRANRSDLLKSGVGLGAKGAAGGRGLAIAGAERELLASTNAANAALKEQIGLLGKAGRAGRGRRGGGGDDHGSDDRGREHYIRHHGVVGYVAGGAAGYASAHGVMTGVEHAVRAGANYQHEVVALQNSGRTPEELAEIHEASKRTTAALPTASYEENLKVANETTSAFGSLEHALEHLTFMQKAASVVHAAAGDKVKDDAGEMGNKMARFAEERGTAGDGETFERETGKLVRAMVFTRGNFNPQEMLNFAQQAKSSLQGYNERFLTGIMPSIVATMGGDRAGTAANAFTGVIDGKVNDKKQAEEWLKLGLLDKSQAIMKAGHAMGWRTGAIKDTAGAHADPLQWIEDVVLPALKEKGGRDGKGIDVDDQEQLKQALATLFRNQNANFFANELAQKKMRGRLLKDEHLQTGVGSMDEIYRRNLANDPKVALTGLTASLENLMSTATSPGMIAAAQGITGLARGINALANAASDHPKLAMAAGAAAATGALAGAGALSYGIANGFGLGASAAALDGSAAALTAAAAKLGGGSLAADAAGAAGGAAGTAKKVSQAGRFVKGVAGVTAVGALAELARETNVLQPPDASDGLGRAAVEALDPGLADRIFGESSAVGRQRRANRTGDHMRGIRASAAATATGSGRLGFGLNGPQAAADAVPLGTPGSGVGPKTGFGASPFDAGEIREGTAALAAYRAELASIKSDMAATAGLDLPGLGEGLEKRKGELEGLITQTEGRLKSLGEVVIAPRADVSGLQSITNEANNAAGALSRVIALSGQARASIGAVNASAGVRAASAGSQFHDGGTPGYGAG